MESTAQNRVSFDTVAIAGVGLLGGSIAAAIKANGLAQRVVGIGRNPQRLDAAKTAGLIDSCLTDVDRCEANLVIVCMPIHLIVSTVRLVAAASAPGTLITDVGSTKGKICRDLDGNLPNGIIYIGSHPIAGSEKIGFEHSNAQLFDKSVCVITPAAAVPRDQVARLTAFWSAIGATVVSLSPEEHDRALAETSHAPHVVAAALVAGLQESNRQFTGPGFRDTTRIAAGNPELWSAILLTNVDAVLQSIGQFSEELSSLREAIENRDSQTLQNLLRNAKTSRDELS